MNSNGKITAPINLASDVYSVLVISPQNGVYDVGYACSNKHGKINRFSFKKPMRIGVLYTQTDLQFEANHCGMTAVEALISGTPPKLVCQPWTYDAPTGGSSSPYRLADFNGYNHNAVAPIRLQQTEITYNKSSDISGLNVYANFAVKDDATGEFIRYGDTENVEISLDQLVTRQPRLTWWGLAIVNGNEVLVANSDNNLDQSDKGYNYSPGVVKIGDWKLGEYLKGLPAGSTVQLVPIINTSPTGGGRPNGIDKNGGISNEPLCFPDGKLLTIRITESPTGIFTLATWGLTGPITIYVKRGTVLTEIGHFGISGSDEGAFGEWIGGASTTTAVFYMGVIVSPKAGAFTIMANQWQMDFSQFPHDPNYYLGDNGYVTCTGIATSNGGNPSASLEVSQNRTIYFVAEVTQLSLMQSFYTQSKYRGPVSLRNSSSNQTAATDYYTIPSTKQSLQ